jgi:hypothetical protein
MEGLLLLWQVDPVRAINAYGGGGECRHSFTLFFTWSREGDELSDSRPGRLSPDTH